MCSGTAADEARTATTLANASNVTFAVGGAGLIAGIVGLVLARRRAPAIPPLAFAPVRLVPILGAGTAGVRAVF